MKEIKIFYLDLSRRKGERSKLIDEFEERWERDDKKRKMN